MQKIQLQRKIILIVLLTFIFANFIFPQLKKQTLAIEDIKLWRKHSVTLSDDGNWYTVLYSLTEKPDEKTGKKKTKKKLKKKEKKKEKLSIYGKNAETDTLYIRNSKSKKEYKIKNGSKPVFSFDSNWVAYIIKPESPKKKEKKTKSSDKTIEIMNLKTGKTRKWKANVSFQFIENANYFLSFDKTSLLLYNLRNLKEHYIGNIGDYLAHKRSNFIVYTINTKDKRGNGIYIYDLKTNTTKALETGNFNYSKISWNNDKTAIAAFKYKKGKKDEKLKNIRIITINDISSDKTKLFEYKDSNISGLPKNMTIAVDDKSRQNKIIWSLDNNRLFLNLKKNDAEKDKKDTDESATKISSVNVWHWKDKKLLSQQMIESKKKNKFFKAVFIRSQKKIIQLTSKKIQKIYQRTDTDTWALGTDNRKYISDWDVKKNDIYRIDLKTGDKKLILEKHNGRINISPNGKNTVFWKDGHYWYYNFKDNIKKNITKNLKVSFLNKEHDYYGSSPAYGFIGWIKDQKAILVNHKLDIWKLPLDNKIKAVNLTESVRKNSQIRFRFDDKSFYYKPEMEKRYIDLSKQNFLFAFNIKTKYAGYYQLKGNKIKKLMYKPASFSSSRWRSGITKAKKSKTVIYKTSNYQKYPESFLSNINFSKSKKITNTNPQQSKYKWGHRILVDYKNDDGVPLQGILSIPNSYKKGQKLPMIVYSYEKISDRMYRYSSPRISSIGFSEMAYVSDGYLVLQPDIYFNVGTPHSDMHECIDAAIKKVIGLGYVDEKKIGYNGFSFGGHCGMYISTQKNKFTAITAGAGVSNLVQGFNIDIVRDGSNEQDYYMTQQGRLGASPVDKPEIYIKESAVFNAKGMNTPLLLYHGTADNVVLWEHSFGLYSILRFLKKPVILLSYRGEGHGLRKKENRLDIQKRLKDYFDYYLKGKKAAKWIIDGLPYKSNPKQDKKKKKETSRKVPMWK